MSIEKDLQKCGIKVLEPLDNSSVLSIAQNVSEKIYAAFPNYEFTREYLYDTLSKVKLYMAEIPNGLSEASYFYKNDSIYFRNGMGIKDIERFSVHEFIHHIQVRKNSKGRLIGMGLCEYSGSKTKGMALNEAAVQLITSNILDATFETVEYYGITFSTISANAYPLLCNLVAQMAYVTGEEVLFESTFDTNQHFKNKFIALCNEKTYEKIVSNLDKILDIEEKIILLNNILQNKDLFEHKSLKLMSKITSLKDTLQKLYFETQNCILSSYSETMFQNLISLSDIDNVRRHLYNYQDLIGISADNKDFNDFYIQMMERLEARSEELTGNTYLVPRRENRFMKFIHSIKNLITLKHFSPDENDN